MDIYKDTWQVEMPTIPNFIFSHNSFIFKGFRDPAFWVYAIFTPFPHELLYRKPCLIQIAAQPDPRIQM